MLNIGQRVRVKVRGLDNWIHAPSRDRVNVYEGTVVKGNPRLDPPDTFCLLTGNPNHPVSIIANRNVVEVESLGGATKHVAKKIAGSDTRTIKVISKSNKEYAVTLFSSGLIKCNCAGYEHRSKCRHKTLAFDWLIQKYGLGWNKIVFKEKT
jgi:hypothetical protein